ncbi:hypothetical protein BD560DRAFT_432304 [Blakeslea trispora]|nr:hypothetical protein BD560DRAFT_432304 [Blakeslea trispora]
MACCWLLLFCLLCKSNCKSVPKHHTWKRKDVVEDTFVKNQFADALDVILNDGDRGILQYEWCNKKLSSCILKPDYTLFFEDEEDEQFEAFVVEVKAPQRNRNSNDFIKLGFTLKSMLDKFVQNGMKSPHVVGLLVDGFNCSFYMMTIEHESIYKMIQLEAFSLPKSANDLPLLKNLLEVVFRAFASQAFEEFEAQRGTESELLPLCRFAAK